ncbi:Hint domain-containing protein [Jannaschia pohangensis]|nr:Hint domain-containing protein [Jannaschia pohangensis]
MTQPVLFSRPAFPISELSPDAIPRFMSGTLFATSTAPRAIEAISVGDSILTKDGPRRVSRVAQTNVLRQDWAYHRDIWPVRVPVGSLGNARPLRLSPDQRVILSGQVVRKVCGVAALSVPCRDLVGLRGLIVERPLADLRYYGISFGIPAQVDAEGVWCDLDETPPCPVDREAVREAYQAMHAAGEPALRPLE